MRKGRKQSVRIIEEGIRRVVKEPAPQVVPHYGDDIYEAIRIIEHYKLGFNLGNVIKYTLRADLKGERLADLEKAMNYLYRELYGEWMPERAN
jgi:hypothetical protein